MNDILNMNPSTRGPSQTNTRFFGEEEAPVEPEKKEVEITSITKSSPVKETKPYSRLENFYKFMDNIEEET